MGSSNNDTPLNYCYRRSESQVYQLINNLGKLFTDRNLFDCSIICEGNQVIRGHKLMLSASSDYFKTAFTSFGGGGGEGNDQNNGHFVSHSCSNTAIIIREIPYSDLKLIIEYIYSGEMIIPAGQLSSVQKSCQWLKVNCLPLMVPASGSVPNKSVTKVNSNSNAICSPTNRIKIKSDHAIQQSTATVPPTTIKINNGRLSISDKQPVTNGHQGSVTNSSLNRVPSLLYPLRSTNQQPLIKIVDSTKQSTDQLVGGLKGGKTNLSPLTSPLTLKIVSSPNETGKVYSTSFSSFSAGGGGEPFVQLRELLRREPVQPESGNDGNGNRNDSIISNHQEEESGVEKEFDQNRVDQMKRDGCNDVGDDAGDDHKRMDYNHEEGGKRKEENMKIEDDKQDELIVEEEVGGDEVVIEEDEEEEEEEDGNGYKYNECNDGGQGQEVDNSGYLSSEEFEIDIPRSNELHQQSDQPYHSNLQHDDHHHPHGQNQKMDITEESNVMTTNEVEIEEEDEEEEEDERDRGRVGGRVRSERIESSGEQEEDDEDEDDDDEDEDEDDDEDEVIDMRVNSGRRFDHHHIGQHHHHHQHHQHRHHPYSNHHSLAAAFHQQGQNLEAAAAAVAAVAAVAASTAGSTSGSTVNLLDECPSSDSLDLDCGDKLRATNYSMIPFTASIASSFNSATARAIAASTTLAVASGLLSKSQQLQNHSSSSSSSTSTTIPTTANISTPSGINGTHSSSSSTSHPHNHHSHSHEIIYKPITSVNPDSHSEVSTVPLKRGRGRPPRHLRETPINGSSSTPIHSTTTSTLEPFRAYKVRNILPSVTTSDLILHTTNNTTTTSKGNNPNNQLNGDTTNHQQQHHHLILSTSSNLGLPFKRKIRLNTNTGLIGLVNGPGGSTKGRKPKLLTQSADCSNNNNNGKNVCPFCPQVYYSNQAMNDHINNVHTGNSRKYTCDLCSKEFSWKISLTKHLRNSHKPDKLTEQLTSNNNNLIDSRHQQQLTLTNM